MEDALDWENISVFYFKYLLDTLDQFFDDEDFLSDDLLEDFLDPLFHDDFEPYLPDDFLPEFHEDFFEDFLFEFDFSEIAITFKFEKKIPNMSQLKILTIFRAFGYFFVRTILLFCNGRCIRLGKYFSLLF
jgi:hypothetical protein